MLFANFLMLNLHTELAQTDSQEYVGRYFHDENRLSIGRIVKSGLSTGYFIAPNGTSILAETTFELLTNPYGCTVQWGKSLGPDSLKTTALDFAFPDSPPEQGFVGRAHVNNLNKYVTGLITETGTSFLYPDWENNQVLVSHNKKLHFFQIYI